MDIKKVKEYVAEIIQKEQKKPFEELQNEAIKYIRTIQKILEKQESKRYELQNKVQTNITLIDQIKIYLSSHGNIFQKSEVQQAYLAMHSFQNQLNKFLNREIYLTYVDEGTGQVIFHNSIGEKEIYGDIQAQKSQSSIKGKFSAKINKALNIESGDEELKKLQSRFEKARKQRFLIYQQAIRRLNQKKQEIKYKKKMNNENSVYWRYNERNHLALSPALNKGKIAEMYLDSIMNDVEDINVSKNFTFIHGKGYTVNKEMEKALQALCNRHTRLNKEGEKVILENTEGIITGDITLEKRIRGIVSDASFAVKKEGADAEGLNPSLMVAFGIIAMGKAASKKRIEENLSSMVSFIPKAQGGAKAEAQRALYQEIGNAIKNSI